MNDPADTTLTPANSGPPVLPWYRRRWFLILLRIPAALGLIGSLPLLFIGGCCLKWHWDDPTVYIHTTGTVVGAVPDQMHIFHRDYRRPNDPAPQIVNFNLAGQPYEFHTVGDYYSKRGDRIGVMYPAGHPEDATEERQPLLLKLGIVALGCGALWLVASLVLLLVSQRLGQPSRIVTDAAATPAAPPDAPPQPPSPG